MANNGKDSLWSGPRGAGRRRRRRGPVKAAQAAAGRAGKRAVRRAGKKVMSTADAMVKAVTNGAKERTTYRKVKDLVRTYGEDGAAERLGVKKGTLRAWTNPDRSKRRAPSAANATKIQEQHNDQQVRQKLVPRRKYQKMMQNGMKVNLTGSIGPYDQKYERFRTIALDLPPAAGDQLINAFVEGGPNRATEVLADLLGEYFGTVDAGETIPASIHSLVDASFTARDEPWEE